MLEKKSIESVEERGVLLGLITKKQTEEQTKEYLDELAFLATTAGIVTDRTFIQRLEYPNPRTFMGDGKINEIANYIAENKINVAIFDDDLSPSQIRNIEKIFQVKILDRSNLILDIFADRAQTASAKVQVELARYEYLLPRLSGMWTHLERQRGSTGTRSGAGEKEIETDRRIVKAKISLLKQKLTQIDKQKATQRKNRESLVRVALVGYTNVGKSTIMNLLSKSNVFAENKLFATLDTTVRKVVFENLPFLLSDTVGFIRKLPHQLVESFKSTLEELKESDLLVHVVDVSHPNFEDHIRVVNETLNEIGAGDKPTIIVFNKIDQYHFNQDDEFDFTSDGPKKGESPEKLKLTWMAKGASACVFISALEKTNIDELKKTIYEQAKSIHSKIYPYNSFLY